MPEVNVKMAEIAARVPAAVVVSEGERHVCAPRALGAAREAVRDRRSPSPLSARNNWEWKAALVAIDAIGQPLACSLTVAVRRCVEEGLNDKAWTECGCGWRHRQGPTRAH